MTPQDRQAKNVLLKIDTAHRVDAVAVMREARQVIQMQMDRIRLLEQIIYDIRSDAIFNVCPQWVLRHTDRAEASDEKEPAESA